jgi:mannose-6-phosphate isomerase-like protein (cupin superfamily)
MTLTQNRGSVGNQLLEHIGRHSHKMWDWDAFPASKGFPELARAQMRYIGAGGSPKVGDTSTLAPSCFTCSLIYLDSPRYAAAHNHEIEEVFWVHSGRLTVSWEAPDGEWVDVLLGPGDALLNPPDVVHGFRNEGPEPVLAQFMVGHPKPLMPKYKYHPSQGDAGPEFGKPLPDASDPNAQWIAGYVIRAAESIPRWVRFEDGSRLGHQPYVLPGGPVEPGHYCLEMVYLPSGSRSPLYCFEFETGFMVWSGVLGVEWQGTDGADTSAARLGQRDLVQIPAGQAFRLTNDTADVVRAAMMIGTPTPPADFWESQ